MDILLHTVHILSALALIGLILIQQGKGADAGASFGGGASQTVFGSAGSGNFLTRSTAVLAVVFMASSLGLAWMARQGAGPVDETRQVLETIAPESIGASEEVPVVEDEAAPSGVPEVPDDAASSNEVPAPEGNAGQ